MGTSASMHEPTGACRKQVLRVRSGRSRHSIPISAPSYLSAGRPGSLTAVSKRVISILKNMCLQTVSV